MVSYKETNHKTPMVLGSIFILLSCGTGMVNGIADVNYTTCENVAGMNINDFTVPKMIDDNEEASFAIQSFCLKCEKNFFLKKARKMILLKRFRLRKNLKRIAVIG